MGVSTPLWYADSADRDLGRTEEEHHLMQLKCLMLGSENVRCLMIGSKNVKCLMISSKSAGIPSPGRGFGGRDRAVHGDWSREVDQAAGAAEARSRGAGEGDVGVLVTDTQEEAELSPLNSV